MIDTNATAVGEEIDPRKMNRRGTPLWKPLLVFILFALAVSLVGNVFLQRHRESIKRDAQEVLGGIAELKAAQITNWMAERRGDAQALQTDPVFVGSVERWLHQGSPAGGAKEKLTERLASVRQAYAAVGYISISLFDDKAVLRLTSGAEEPLHQSEKNHLSETLRSGQVSFSEIHRKQNGLGERFEIELCAPLTLVKEGKAQTIGALLFRIDPYRFIFPLIEHWPTPSASAENLLVRRGGGGDGDGDDDDVIFLNELRHHKDADDFLRLPLDRHDLLAAMAATGKEGMVEGLDYRGVPVVGVISRVPGTSWKMVSKIDRTEIYAPINDLSKWVMLLMLILICAGAGVALFWRLEEVKQFQGALRQRKLAERLDYLSKNANDIIMLADDKGRIADFNNRALEAYGYTAEEFRGLSLPDLRKPHYAAKLAEDFRKVHETGSMRFESVHLRSNGEEFPVEISASVIHIGGKEFQQAIIRDIGERKKAEEELRRGQMFIRKVIDSDPNFIFVKDAEGRFLLANEAMAKSFGLTTESIVGKYNWQLTPNAEHLAEYDQTNKQALEQENREWSGLQRAILADGREHVFHTIRKTLQQDDGSTTLLTVAVDITELKDAEARLESERTRLRTLVQTIPDIVWLKDTYGTYLGCNPQFERYFGVKESEIVGRTDRDLVDAQLADFRLQKDMEAIAAGKARVSEEWITYPDNGERALVEVIRMPMRDESGGLAGVMGIARNITERKRTEEELRFKNTLLTTEHEVSIDGILVVDDNGNILSHNRRFVEIWSPHEEFGATGCNEKVLQSIRDLLAEPEQFIGKLEYLHEHRDETSRDEIVLRDGRVLEHYTAPMTGPQGEYYGRIWYFRDITELKLSAMNLARSYAQLQRLSLRMENVKAEEREKIALNLHDEMGATLAAMKMRISWLSSKLPAEAPHLQEEAAHISELVSDGIQTMHHIVTQLKPSLLGDVGLAVAIRDYVKKFQQHTNVECELRLPDGDLMLDADQSMTLFRILQECLNNVVKHSQATRVKIFFTEKEESLSMAIKDNGIGFDTSTQREQSFGLLGIRERALMVGGKARVSSTPGKGTSISVSIPHAAIHADADAHHMRPARPPSYTTGVES